jgi:hypothetical protein
MHRYISSNHILSHTLSTLKPVVKEGLDTIVRKFHYPHNGAMHNPGTNNITATDNDSFIHHALRLLLFLTHYFPAITPNTNYVPQLFL